MALIVLLILTEDQLFNKTVHSIMLKGVTWYQDRVVSEISLGGLIILVTTRTAQYNLLKMRVSNCIFCHCYFYMNVIYISRLFLGQIFAYKLFCGISKHVFTIQSVTSICLSKDVESV